jgi:hypothetical protein
MKLIECAARACTEVNYLRRTSPGLDQAALAFVEGGWQQVTAEDFMCPDHVAIVLRDEVRGRL